MAKAGHHGDVVYVFEDSDGFNSASSPTDSTFKTFGSDATMDTFEGSHQAERVFNADRTAAEIVRQVFDGSWSVSFNLSEPPWWLCAVLGDPSSTQQDSTGVYDHDYDLDNSNDLRSLRLYMPTDGFTDYEYIGGAVIASVDINQDVPGLPQVTLSGAYAEEPQRANSLSPSAPSLAEATFSNRHAALTVDGTTVARVQSANLTLETGTEIINELGSDIGVDFSPKMFAPDVTYEKIITEDQSLDPLKRFKDANSVSLVWTYDNGETGTDQHKVELTVSTTFPNDWSESGRNDPEADLIEELSEMGADLDVVATNSTDSPPSG